MQASVADIKIPDQEINLLQDTAAKIRAIAVVVLAVMAIVRAKVEITPVVATSHDRYKRSVVIAALHDMRGNTR